MNKIKVPKDNELEVFISNLLKSKKIHNSNLAHLLEDLEVDSVHDLDTNDLIDQSSSEISRITNKLNDLNSFFNLMYYFGLKEEDFIKI